MPFHKAPTPPGPPTAPKPKAPSADDLFVSGMQKYWADKVPTGIPAGVKTTPSGAPPPRPETAQRLPNNWNQLNKTERWLYTKGLPWVEEQGWLDRLENLNQSWVGKALLLFDVLAEGVERSVGLVAQYKDASEKNEVPKFIEEFGSVWRAGSMAFDVMGAPGVAVTASGAQTYSPLDISESALAKARQLIVNGATTEEARATLYEDMGALAFRATINDAIGHIFIDPLNFILPKVAPITRLHKLRADAIYRSGRIGAEAVQGARIAENTAFEALDAARKAGKPLNENADLLAKAMAASEAAVEAEAAAVKKLGEATFTNAERFAIWATGGRPLSDAASAEWLVRAPKGWKKVLPWNWFKLTPMSRANEVLVNVGIHAQGLVNQGSSVESIVGAFNRGVSGALGDQVGHIMMTPAGRAAQSWMKHAAAEVNDLHAAYKVNALQRDQLHAVARLLNVSADEVVSRLVKGEAKIVTKELLEAGANLGDDAPFAVKALVESMEGGFFSENTLQSIGKIFDDQPFNLDVFKQHAIIAIWDSTAKTAVTQLGIKEAGFFTRMTSSLKTIETLAFLRLNPGYAVRNFLNNELTMLARGNWGAWESTAHLMNMWDRIGVTHPRLTSGFGAAGITDVGLAAKRASTLIEEAFQQAQGVLGDAALAKKNWLGVQINKISEAKFPGDMGEFAKSAESWASIRAMSKGYNEAWSWFWRPRAPSAFDARLADLPKDVEKSILNGVSSAMGEAELDAVVASKNLNISIGAVMDGAAERAGVSIENIDDIFGHGFGQALATELMPAIKSGNPEEVASVLRAARQRHQRHITNILEEEWVTAYRGNLELMDVDGPGGVLRSWGETAGHEFGMWESHLKSVETDAARIRALPEGTRGPAWIAAKEQWAEGWNNYNKWYKARMKGMVDGAKRAGIPIPDTVIKAVDDRLAAIKKFHATKNRLLNKHFKAKFDTSLAKEQDWFAVKDDLDKLYTKLANDQFNLSKVVDDGMANSVEGSMVPRYKSWRTRVRNARHDYMMDMRQMYRTAYDDGALAAEGMKNSAQYFDEVVGPTRASHMQAIFKEEKEGLQMLAGGPTSDRIQQGVARTLVEGTAEDVVGMNFRRDPREVTRILLDRGPPVPRNATKVQGSAIGSAAENVEHSSGIPFGPAGPFSKVDIPAHLQVPLFRSSTGKVFTYEAESVTDGIRAYAAAIQDELEAQGLFDTAEIMGKFVRTIEDDIAAQRLLSGARQMTYFPDALKLVPEQKPVGLTTNELWMRDGARIYDGIEEASLELINKPPIRFDGLDPATQNALRDYIEAMKGELGQARNASMYMAEFKRDSALLNYSRRTNFDAFTSQIFPFSFWTTHSMYNWALWSIERPAMLSTYLKLRKLFETSKGRKNLPRRMRGMGFGFKVPFLGKDQEWMGPLFFNPLKIGLPIENFTYPFERMAQDVGDDRQRAARFLERQLEGGEITDEQYLAAIQTQSGNEWREAMSQVANGRDTWLDFSQYLVAPHAPAVWAYNAARGRDFQPGPFLPITRTIKGITAMMGVRQGGQEGGWNIERALRIELGLPEFDAFDDYRVDRMLSSQAATGEITADENLRAVIDRDGPIFQEAQRRAGIEFGVRAAASSLGIPVMAYPPGEEKARELADQWGEAYEKYKKGDTNFLVEFYEKHPEVKGRLGLFDSPEDRVTRFLVDNLNDQYYSAPSLTKRQIRDELGDEFVRNFLATGTRDPMSISPEKLGMWLKLIGGDPPGTLGDDALPLTFAPPDVAYRAQSYYNTRSTYFPDYFEQQEDYFKLKEGKPRKQYLVDHKDFAQYREWKKDWLLRNPDVAPYLTEFPPLFESEQALREAEAAQPNFLPQEWQQLLGLPAYNLTLDLFEGEDLPPVAQDKLDELAGQLGLSGWEEVAARIADASGEELIFDPATGQYHTDPSFHENGGGNGAEPQVDTQLQGALGNLGEGSRPSVPAAMKANSTGKPAKLGTADFDYLKSLFPGLKPIVKKVMNNIVVNPSIEEQARGFAYVNVKHVRLGDRYLEQLIPGKIELARGLGFEQYGEWTLLHEIAHQLDTVGTGRRLSETGSWDRAVERVLDVDPESVAGQPYQRNYWQTHTFPGIGEVPMSDVPTGQWGGPVELFAVIFSNSEGDIRTVPPPMREFFDNFMAAEAPDLERINESFNP